jgi:hypothetical protein
MLQTAYDTATWKEYTDIARKGIYQTFNFTSVQLRPVSFSPT